MNAIEALRGIVRDYDAALHAIKAAQGRVQALTYTIALRQAHQQCSARLFEAVAAGEVFLDDDGYARLAMTGTPMLNPDTFALL